MNPVRSSPLYGMVCWWPFDVADIPGGWVICDGENGTPDMRGFLAIGARAGFDSGAILGSSEHTHRGGGMTSVESDNHQHNLSGDTAGPGPGSFDLTDIGGAVQEYSVHTHAFSVVTDDQSQTHHHRYRRKLTDPADSKQLSRETIFIMKT